MCNCNGRKIYCNTDNGWCGDSDSHKHAQRGDEYNCPWPSPYPLIGDAPVDPNTWEIVVGKGKYYSPSKGETFLRDGVENSANKILYRYCLDCADTHKQIF